MRKAIDDTTGHIVAAFSSLPIKGEKAKKVDVAKKVGEELGQNSDKKRRKGGAF